MSKLKAPMNLKRPMPKFKPNASHQQVLAFKHLDFIWYLELQEKPEALFWGAFLILHPELLEKFRVE
jgi:hypothetical protein